jgi:hypothetical protein
MIYLRYRGKLANCIRRPNRLVPVSHRINLADRSVNNLMGNAARNRKHRPFETLAILALFSSLLRNRTYTAPIATVLRLGTMKCLHDLQFARPVVNSP